MMYHRVYNDPFLRFLAESSQMENRKKNQCGCAPSANVIENNESFRIEMAIPGFSREDVKITVEKDILTVESVKQEPKEEVKYTRREFGMYEFKRSWRLTETIDQDQIRAEFNNGILTLILPKKQEVKVTKEISIA